MHRGRPAEEARGAAGAAQPVGWPALGWHAIPSSPSCHSPFHVCLVQGVDADTVVFVADPNTGNILNFNVGDNVDFKVPRVGPAARHRPATAAPQGCQGLSSCLPLICHIQSCKSTGSRSPCARLPPPAEFLEPLGGAVRHQGVLAA